MSSPTQPHIPLVFDFRYDWKATPWPVQASDPAICMTVYQLQNANEIFLHRIEWCKRIKPPYHEFLVFYLKSKDGSRGTVAVLERTVVWNRKYMDVEVRGPNGEGGPNEPLSPKELPEEMGLADVPTILAQLRAKTNRHVSSSTDAPAQTASQRPNSLNSSPMSYVSSSVSSVSSSSEGRPSIDTLLFSGSFGHPSAFINNGGFFDVMFVVKVKGNLFSLCDLVVLASTIHDFYPRYTVLEYQCYWYARVNYLIILEQLGSRNIDLDKRASSSRCGKFGIIPMPKISKKPHANLLPVYTDSKARFAKELDLDRQRKKDEAEQVAARATKAEAQAAQDRIAKEAAEAKSVAAEAKSVAAEARAKAAEVAARELKEENERLKKLVSGQ